MSDKNILEELVEGIEFSVMTGDKGNVLMLEETKREIITLRQLKRDVKDQLDMAMFAYGKGDDCYVKGIIEELIKIIDNQ